jgi:deoxyxylulose-5-phosphate synthase
LKDGRLCCIIPYWMDGLLEQIDSPEDLKRLSVSELKALAEEIRQLIIGTVSKTGGHLASSLGVVELSIALHYAFDFKTDRLLWDVVLRAQDYHRAKRYIWSVAAGRWTQRISQSRRECI